MAANGVFPPSLSRILATGSAAGVSRHREEGEGDEEERNGEEKQERKARMRTRTRTLITED